MIPKPLMSLLGTVECFLREGHRTMAASGTIDAIHELMEIPGERAGKGRKMMALRPIRHNAMTKVKKTAEWLRRMTGTPKRPLATKGTAPIALTLLLLSLIGTVPSTGRTGTPPSPTDSSRKGVGSMIWTWSDTSERKHAVFLSRQIGNSWENPQKVSTNDHVNIVPAVIATSTSDLMVIWTTYVGTESQLHYRLFKDDHWTEEQVYLTGLPSNLAPSLALDGKGRIWLAWVGYNGISDEIYVSTWDGTSFAAAVPITHNDIPDIQPVLGIDTSTGTPWVQWRQFSTKGYTLLESAWTGTSWSEPLEVASTTQDTASSKTAENLSGIRQATATANGETAPDSDLEFEIPDFIKNPRSASIHVPGYAIQSLPVRTIATDK